MGGKDFGPCSTVSANNSNETKQFISTNASVASQVWVLGYHPSLAWVCSSGEKDMSRCNISVLDATVKFSLIKPRRKKT